MSHPVEAGRGQYPRQVGFATEEGVLIDRIGEPLKLNQRVPDFRLLHIDPVTREETTFTPKDLLGKITIIMPVNELNTKICDLSVVEWEKRLAKLPSDVQVITVSKQGARYLADYAAYAAGDHKIERQRLMSAQGTFGEDFGVALDSSENAVWKKMLLRSAFVIGPDGLVKHIQEEPDQMRQIDYNAVEQAALETYEEEIKQGAVMLALAHKDSANERHFKRDLVNVRPDGQLDTRKFSPAFRKLAWDYQAFLHIQRGLAPSMTFGASLTS